MRIDIVSLVPSLFQGAFSHCLIKKAIQQNLLQVYIHDLRSYGLGPRKQVDAYPYGGGSGMVIRIEPVHQCFSKLVRERNYDEIIFMTPDGEMFTQKHAKFFAKKKNIILLCGRYKGIDQRIRDHLISKEISIGHYILSGGELAAAVFVDSVVRLLPGVIHNQNSILTDSFQNETNAIAPPIYTRPSIYQGWKVPEVLLSGNHKKIKNWLQVKSMELNKTLDFTD
ncbi:tRNA (guanosine(37)-N1)-methyltransferase TrmD [Blattabacterium cuenoti]|uniref:tRNA (guanosine(37)-N1)-methyltransferase TrmD n=1 Tax=Blattabacterium cuenoti TaxID=1653831 RepID=UPI00163CDAE2|nr:tRNA (guanosine(37)-N1)-methyltransferase TrmD [Blattabacterium cuenoti]